MNRRKVLKELEKKAKGLVFSAAVPLARRGKRNNGKFDPESVKRVLVVRQDERLGNLILITPLLSALRRRLPSARIDILMAEKFADLFSHDPRIDRVYAFNKKEHLKDPRKLLALFKSVRAGGYDLHIDASDERNFSVSAAIAALFSGARFVLGHEKDGSEKYLDLKAMPEEGCHAAQHQLRLMELIGERVEDIPLSVSIPEAEVERAREKYRHSKGKLCSLHIGGRGAKRWDFDRYVELVRRMPKLGYSPLIIAGPAERPDLEKMQRALGDDARYVDSPPILALAAILRVSDLYISADTGPLHLAVACGCPTVSLFLTSDPQKYAPRGPKHAVLTAHEGGIGVEEVTSAIGSLAGR